MNLGLELDADLQTGAEECSQRRSYPYLAQLHRVFVPVGDDPVDERVVDRRLAETDPELPVGGVLDQVARQVPQAQTAVAVVADDDPVAENLDRVVPGQLAGALAGTAELAQERAVLVELENVRSCS